MSRLLGLLFVLGVCAVTSAALPASALAGHVRNHLCVETVGGFYTDYDLNVSHDGKCKPHAKRVTFDEFMRLLGAPRGAFRDPRGVKGPRGATGAAGPAGPAGPQGIAGPAGPTGPRGAPGSAGPAGAQGAAGPAGSQGAAGARGAPGATGPQGLRGQAGAAGPAGPQGLRGATGAAGARGPAGTTGARGPAGALRRGHRRGSGSDRLLCRLRLLAGRLHQRWRADPL